MNSGALPWIVGFVWYSVNAVHALVLTKQANSGSLASEPWCCLLAV